ncbi:hypoxanthine-guanine phosphoribosyltransferase [Lysobacter sp. HDW10]|jgi:hypoxanthine phosphoribosyltransferase|uniref:hypoxanthine-guanine phosphoribosyltransferase n=1 Tax=Lysobacter sp. HDW10 TaxID=2714936 RepID=UPI00140C5D2C|nr:hypoxanthine-guanine phosphoribosyltransferase [Lysobacter sp. HDW10]QIK81779.1 hypoxanthine-guanine phosphoribosyltransferase [Lysobacter sp. HDW10]
MTRPSLSDALARADVIHDAASISDAVKSMAIDIADEYRDDAQAPLFVTVMNGGMPFAADLAMALGDEGLDVEFDYLHATRYRGETSGGSRLAWLHRPNTPLRDRRVLLVDDILDEGHTMLAVKRWCEDQGAADVLIAVAAIKVHDRCVEGIDADFVGLEVPDAYVFGYGMDYHEQGRNLRAIFALRT